MWVTNNFHCTELARWNKWMNGINKLQMYKILQPNGAVAHNGMITLSLHIFSSLPCCSEGFSVLAWPAVTCIGQVRLRNNRYSQCDTEKPSHRRGAHILQTSNKSTVVHLLPWTTVNFTSWKPVANTWNRASIINRPMFYKWKGTGRKCHLTLKQYWHENFLYSFLFFFRQLLTP